jgi:hypothetical protein
MARTYLESISHFDEGLREELIKWATRTRFWQVPRELSFLHRRFVDLGFEKLAATQTRQQLHQGVLSSAGLQSITNTSARPGRLPAFETGHLHLYQRASRPQGTSSTSTSAR